MEAYRCAGRCRRSSPSSARANLPQQRDGQAPGKHGCGLANALVGSRLWVTEVCARAVYIGDNSKLFLESAEPRRALRPTAKTTVLTLCSPLPVNAP